MDFSVLPQKQSFCGSPIILVRGNRYNVFPLGTFAHWVKAQPCALGQASRLHWMKRHVSGRPHRVAPTSDYGTFANYKYMSSVTDIVGQGSHSVRTCLILPGFRRGDPASDYGTFANYKYMSNVTDIVGQGSHSVRTRLI